MKRKPKNEHEIYIVLDKRGTTIYSNRQGFKLLAQKFDELSRSGKKQYNECHFLWHIEKNCGALSNRERRNVFVFFENGLEKIFAPKSKNERGFDLTFMVVEANDLNEMRKYKKFDKLPSDWLKRYKRSILFSC